MAKYTTQLRHVIESGVDIFDFDYPIFDVSYRTVLEGKIIDHFYFREIGFETVGQFKWFLRSKMNRIMPYYNQLYETEGLITKDDYAFNLNSTETHTRTISQTNSGTTDSTSDSNNTETNKDVFSDTPQAKVQDLDYATNLTEGDRTGTEHMTGSVNTTGNAETTETYTTKQLGGGGLRYNADILMEWRKSFLNIDQQIIDELNELFMNVY